MKKDEDKCFLWRFITAKDGLLAPGLNIFFTDV